MTPRVRMHIPGLLPHCAGVAVAVYIGELPNSGFYLKPQSAAFFPQGLAIGGREAESKPSAR